MTAAPAYAEFGVQSNFSFLRGASRPEELVVTARLFDFSAMGLADRNTVAGVVRAWSQSRRIELPGISEPTRIPYHPGCRLVFSDGTPDILAYPQDRQGWAHLCRMLTKANMREESEKGAPILLAEDFWEWGERMSLAVLPEFRAEKTDGTLAFLKSVKARFRENAWLAVAPSYGGDDRWRLAQAAGMAQAAGLRLMATNDVLYHAAEQRPLQDVLTAIRLNTPVTEAGFALEVNAERHMKPREEMARLFRQYPEALAETLRFAESLSFSLGELQHNYPDEPTESGLPAQAELERLTWEGVKERFPGGIPEGQKNLIRKELALVERKNYARYFLTVHDIMRFARSKGILCQGRGSAANSLICYCLRITDVGPEIMDHLLERFISEKRDEPPDIDVDFEHERREEVIATSTRSTARSTRRSPARSFPTAAAPRSARWPRRSGFRRTSCPLSPARSGAGRARRWKTPPPGPPAWTSPISGQSSWLRSPTASWASRAIFPSMWAAGRDRPHR
jgi:DNA polymerase III alpha subunit